MLGELLGIFCCPYFTIWIHLKLGTGKGDIMKRFLHTRKASRLRWRGWKSEGQLLEKLQMAGMVLQNWFIIFLFPLDSSSTYATQVKEDVLFFWARNLFYSIFDIIHETSRNVFKQIHGFKLKAQKVSVKPKIKISSK